MTDRPKRVLRKTPPPPTICGVSTSASHDDLLDEHNPVFVSTDFIRTVMRAVEVISTENGRVASARSRQASPARSSPRTARRLLQVRACEQHDRPPMRMFLKTPPPSSRETPVAGKETRV
jgi:hypothetical protein